MRKLQSMLAAVLLATAVSPLAAEPAAVSAAVANSAARTADNLKLDEGRKPVELLAFLGLQQGMSVIDPFGGNLYWAEIVAPAIGPTGRILIWQPTQFYDEKAKADFATFSKKVHNVSLVSSPFEAPQLPAASADFMLINLDYHDVYWENAKYGIKRMEPDAFLKTVYAAMKPGAVVGVVDHVANAGTPPRESVEKLHRIDPAVIKADFARAGFVLEGESNLYRNPDDDHSLLVFNPQIRGKTDRVVMKFRKPR